ncbi:ACP S-malonyltransferase [Desulfovibrio inopinatus]|uniref:ACP S-malonyltransferase n=1 Tax=Desulfovibrio inopinatus TaxID=102109 RepID=UPI0004161404|nr:ACP S-malonyltransferase [Desulfovibrio inopinatus]
MTAQAHVVLFPGQGSQEKGMGRPLAESWSDAMELWQRAEKISGLALREIYWDGDEKDMVDTRALQPALTVVSLGLWYHLKSKLNPLGVSGHSLGEFAALAAANVLEPDAVLELVSVRGQLMADAESRGGGGMAAVLKLSLEQVEALVDEAASASDAMLKIANFNSPAQFVISGEKKAVDEAVSLAKKYKGRAIPLAVSGAFHSPLMDDAARELEKVMTRYDWRDPAFPVYSCVSATAASDPATLRELMTRQMTSSVRFIETVAAMYDDGARRFIELGPKGVLTKLAAANLKGRNDEFETVNIANAEAAAAFSN